MVPLASIALAAAGHDGGAGAVFEKPLHLDLPLDVVHPQFDQLDAVFGQVAMLGNDVTMTASSDAHADHSISSR